MPAGVVKTKREEKYWDKSKKNVAESKGKSQSKFKDRDWALVTHIFKLRKKKHEGKGKKKKSEAEIPMKKMAAPSDAEAYDVFRGQSSADNLGGSGWSQDLHELPATELSNDELASNYVALTLDRELLEQSGGTRRLAELSNVMRHRDLEVETTERPKPWHHFINLAGWLWNAKAPEANLPWFWYYQQDAFEPRTETSIKPGDKPAPIDFGPITSSAPVVPLTKRAHDIVVEPYEPLVDKALKLIQSKNPSILAIKPPPGQGQTTNQKVKVVVEAEAGDHLGKVQSDAPGVVFISVNKIKNLLGSSQNEDEIVRQIALVIAHELGHIEANLQGGEGPAEVAEIEMARKLNAG